MGQGRVTSTIDRVICLNILGGFLHVQVKCQAGRLITLTGVASALPDKE